MAGMYLTHTAHWQFLGLLTGVVAWILTMATAGLNEWRLWYVNDVSVINSGVAWVGIWRACFYSHVLPSTETCQSLSFSDSFLPAEIPAAQVLMILAVIFGLAGNISAAVAMRLAYFSVEEQGKIPAVFVLAGALYLLTATTSMVPLMWNMSSVLRNGTIEFPHDSYLPAAPARQSVGAAIGVGIIASVMMLLSGMLFLCYRYAWRAPEKTTDPLNGPWTLTTLPHGPESSKAASRGEDNPTFHTEEAL
ncbi:Claudin-34 [Oryzias melastigma]|uniref:Claudin-34 n=1 Tax=Oryzias melastigma TaxID=30732 RepID=A0A834BRP3_ORYME|nr:Claudin-34 [Oryzias melastigma]